MEILDPRARFDDEDVSPTFDLDRPLAGASVGLRFDGAWRSYLVVIEEWKRRLADDGAVPVPLKTGDRVGPGAVQTRADLDDWARLVDCGVVGLGN